MGSCVRAPLAVGGLLLVTLAAGCHVIQTAAEVPAQAVRTVTPQPKAEPAVDPVDVEHALMRFSDEFASRMAVGVEKLRHGTNALEHAESLRWKIAFGTAACTIPSGPNAIANLLDMTVFVTETRLSIEEYWQPKVFGESALPLLDNCRVSEAEIWRIVEKVLKPEQQATLREAIQAWHKQSSLPENLLVVRAVGIALQVARSNKSDTARPGNLLGLLMLDPLTELDPARRELAQTRLFAERALFVGQKMPTLLRWQAELLALETLEIPDVQQWTTNATQIAASADRISRVAEDLPKQVAAERQELVKALETQEGALRPLLDEARQTLAETRQTMEAGKQMSAALDTTLHTFDGVLQRLGVGEPDSPAATNSEPFRIQDYGQVAVQLEAAAKQLTELLRTFDQTLGANSRAQLAAQIAPAVQQAQAEGKELADYVFWRAALLIAIALLAASLYRLLVARLARAAPAKPDKR